MSDQSLSTLLGRYISGSRLELPVDKLGSTAIQQLFERFLPDERLVIDPIDDRNIDHAALGVELQTQLLLQRGKNRRQVGICGRKTPENSARCRRASQWGPRCR